MLALSNITSSLKNLTIRDAYIAPAVIINYVPEKCLNIGSVILTSGIALACVQPDSLASLATTLILSSISGLAISKATKCAGSHLWKKEIKRFDEEIVISLISQEDKNEIKNLLDSLFPKVELDKKLE